MQPFWQSAIEAAEPIHGRLAARVAALRRPASRSRAARRRRDAAHVRPRIPRRAAARHRLWLRARRDRAGRGRGDDARTARRRDRRHRMGRGRQAVPGLCAGDAGIRREPLHDLAPRQWRRTQGCSHVRRSGSSGATAVVELYRAGGEPESADDDITASIGQLRLSTRPALPSTIDTKFGEVAVEPFTDSAPAGARHCLRFSRAFEEPRFELAGWFCNAGEELVDRGMVACALDRLSLVAAGSEPRLGALFARAELKRTFCGQQSVFVAATPKRNDWIEAARDPQPARRAVAARTCSSASRTDSASRGPPPARAADRRLRDSPAPPRDPCRRAAACCGGGSSG